MQIEQLQLPRKSRVDVSCLRIGQTSEGKRLQLGLQVAVNFATAESIHTFRKNRTAAITEQGTMPDDQQEPLRLTQLHAANYNLNLKQQRDGRCHS